MELCLYNTYSDRVVGYCHNPKHPYGITEKQMKCKNCLGKQCKDFEINPKHPRWHQHEIKKQKRKQRKLALDAYVSNIKTQH